MSENNDTPQPEKEPAIKPDATVLREAKMVDEGGPIAPEDPVEADPSTKVAEAVEKAKEESRPDDENTGDDIEDEDGHLDGYDDIADDEPYDVDAALAAIGSLNTMADPIDAPELLPTYDAPTLISNFRQPSLSTLERGQAASVVPALLFIGVGVFLTFLLTSGYALPTANILLGLTLVCIGMSLLAAWLSSGRWARGNLAMGVLALVIGAVLFVV